MLFRSIDAQPAFSPAHDPPAPPRNSPSRISPNRVRDVEAPIYPDARGGISLFQGIPLTHVAADNTSGAAARHVDMRPASEGSAHPAVDPLHVERHVIRRPVIPGAVVIRRAPLANPEGLRDADAAVAPAVVPHEEQNAAAAQAPGVTVNGVFHPMTYHAGGVMVYAPGLDVRVNVDEDVHTNSRTINFNFNRASPSRSVSPISEEEGDRVVADPNAHDGSREGSPSVISDIRSEDEIEVDEIEELPLRSSPPASRPPSPGFFARHAEFPALGPTGATANGLYNAYEPVYIPAASSSTSDRNAAAENVGAIGANTGRGGDVDWRDEGIDAIDQPIPVDVVDEDVVDEADNMAMQQ